MKIVGRQGGLRESQRERINGGERSEGLSERVEQGRQGGGKDDVWRREK